MNPFRKTILLSALGHLAVFGIFGFSFGNRVPVAEYAEPSFWGQFLMNSQVSSPFVSLPGKRLPETILPSKITPSFSAADFDSYSKPQVSLCLNLKKEPLLEKPVQKPLFLKFNQPTVILHPVLPYGFTLYFKDRQIAHVELEYKFDSSQNRNLILLKRKISSGNLEVDLLSLRYIWHYLFIQQADFTPGDWKTVKIDLSAQDK